MTRVIPACAGSGRAAVHALDRDRIVGSSLRVRGAVGQGHGKILAIRVIPACAGSGLRQPLQRSSIAGHPCVCGERPGRLGGSRGYQQRIAQPDRRARRHPSTRLRTAPTLGPPRWNTRNSSEQQTLQSADAGGERAPNAIGRARPAGSSLRVRGTVWSGSLRIASLRVIPACAGNGLVAGRPAGPAAGHPCVCGERADSRLLIAPVNGSSLRVRGTDEGCLRKVRFTRVIPACAGSGTHRIDTTGAIAGHPCVCGERLWLMGANVGCDGSSLRVRGAHHDVRRPNRRRPNQTPRKTCRDRPSGTASSNTANTVAT